MPRWANAFAQAPVGCSFTLVKGPVTTATADSPAGARWRVPISSSPPQRNVNLVCMRRPHDGRIEASRRRGYHRIDSLYGTHPTHEYDGFRSQPPEGSRCGPGNVQRVCGIEIRLSQPATSAALARLRVGLGDPLLVRHGNRMVLSPRAERLVPRVRLVMREIEQVLAEETFDPATAKRAFRIAATDDVIEAILSTFFISVRSSAPGALIDVVAVSDRIEHDLATGKVDLAIAADWWLRRVRQRETILRDTYVGLRRRPGQLNVAAFLKQDHVLVAPHGRKPGVVDAALTRLGRERCVVITVPDFASAARLVAASEMIVTMPSLIAAHYAGAYRLHHFQPPVKLPSLDIAMASDPRSMADAGIAWLAEQIRNHAERLRAG
jgi:DNA-binding transcriptional LysR family regulator